jgi:cytochrome P450
MLGALPHRSLAKLAKKYGPIMSLKLGHVTAIVVSSPLAAELFLKTHDTVFASRPKAQSSEILSYGTKAIAMTHYGSYWRNVRKFCILQLLSASKIEMFAPMRKEEVGLLVEEIREAAMAHEVVDLSRKVKEVVENMTYRMVLGRKKDNEFDLKGLISEGIAVAGAFNLSDYVPYLAPLDLQGFTKRLKALSKSFDKLFEKIISEHEKDESDQKKQHGDFVDVLLSMLNRPMNPNEDPLYIIDKTNIKAIMLDMVAASLDTTSTAINWTLSELLRYPRVMARLQEELETVIGKNRAVEEKDLVNLPYLDMVIKESLRLHPVAPLLIPHESTEELTIDGFYIPNKSRIIVNYWAIALDPNVWSENVDEFLPERFVGSNFNLKGRDFQLIPFGSGRRGCPGMQLGLITVKFVVAQLVHCFDWKLPNGMSPDKIDMSEQFGLAVSRATDLLAMPIYRTQV